MRLKTTDVHMIKVKLHQRNTRGAASCLNKAMMVYWSSPSQQEAEGGAPAPSRYQMLTDVNPAGAVHIECEYPDPASEASGTTTSAVGPGLDSDFGASAGTFQSNR